MCNAIVVADRETAKRRNGRVILLWWSITSRETGKMPLGRRVTLLFKLVALREKRQNAAGQMSDTVVEADHVP